MFNPDQQAAIDAREGQFGVLAGPGSGKTTVLIARYDKLVNSGVPKTDIVCVTFTKEAADSMCRRAKGTKEQFCTFHSLGYRICNQELGYQAVEPELRHRLLVKLSRNLGVDYKELTAFISKMRREGKTPTDVFEETQQSETFAYGLPKAYSLYENERVTAGWMDFDSMLVDAKHLLETNSDVRRRWQFRFPLADEMQDSDNIQWRMMQLMSEKYGNVMVVGDPNQSIYAWRDAHPENLTNFTTWFKNGKYLYLGKNYRSTKTIVDYVRSKAPINTPLNEKMIAARADIGKPIQFEAFDSEIAEARSAVEAASVDSINSAIIGRTNRLLAPLENYCIEKGIKYQLLGRSGFWKQNEVTRAIEKLREWTGVPLPGAIARVWPELERKYAVDDRTQEDNDALANLQTLREISKKFASVLDFTAYANRAAHARKQPRGITIGTIHASKGLEWKNVYVIGLRADVLPHSKGEMGEEKRIFFVAISRAIDVLRLSFAGVPSVFIRDSIPTKSVGESNPTAQQNLIREQLGLPLR